MFPRGAAKEKEVIRNVAGKIGMAFVLLDHRRIHLSVCVNFNIRDIRI